MSSARGRLVVAGVRQRYAIAITSTGVLRWSLGRLDWYNIALGKAVDRA